jgi:predicted N-acetyltransferase YhbS
MSKPPEGNAPVVVRQAAPADAEAMAAVEASAQELLESQGVDLAALRIPEGFEEETTWSLAFVAEVGGVVVGMARLTELTREVICLDQVSTSPRFAGRGVGRQLLTEVVTVCRERGYSAITGTTFRDVAFNAPFYTRMGCVEEPDPHPAMVQRRRVERDLGLDEFGSRLIMRLPL